MNEQTIAQIYLLQQSVLSVIERSRKVISMIDTEQELVEYLQQIAVSLYYTAEALETVVGHRVFSVKEEQISKN